MKKVLLVDDDEGLLLVLQASLGSRFDVETAPGPREGLAALHRRQDFSVIVSDMRMPEMNGIEFLSEARALVPDAIRVMLTANVDQETAIKAVNQGAIFRFLNKPCSSVDFQDTVAAAARQFELVTAERDLLENTLRGSIGILTEILALTAPHVFGYAEKVSQYMNLLCAVMGIRNSWEYEVAAQLSHIGLVTIPPDVISKLRSGKPLSAEERSLFRQIPAIGGRLLSKISRLEEVSRILAYQGKHFDGSGDPEDSLAGEQIPQGARMLKFLRDLLELEAEGKDQATALSQMRSRAGWYDPRILEAFASMHDRQPQEKTDLAKPPMALPLSALRVGLVLLADVLTRDGTLIIAAGNRITPTLLERLRNFQTIAGIREPIKVQSEAWIS